MQSKYNGTVSDNKINIKGLPLAVGLSLLQAGWSGTHYWPSFAVCPSVWATLDARLRRYYSHDIRALSAIEMLHNIMLYKFPILFYSNGQNGMHKQLLIISQVDQDNLD